MFYGIVLITIRKQGHVAANEVNLVDSYDDLHEDDLVVVN